MSILLTPAIAADYTGAKFEFRRNSDKITLIGELHNLKVDAIKILPVIDKELATQPVLYFEIIDEKASFQETAFYKRDESAIDELGFPLFEKIVLRINTLRENNGKAALSEGYLNRLKPFFLFSQLIDEIEKIDPAKTTYDQDWTHTINGYFFAKSRHLLQIGLDNSEDRRRVGTACSSHRWIELFTKALNEQVSKVLPNEQYNALAQIILGNATVDIVFLDKLVAQSMRDLVLKECVFLETNKRWVKTLNINSKKYSNQIAIVGISHLYGSNGMIEELLKENWQLASKVGK